MHNLIMPDKPMSVVARYLPAEKDALLWGLYVTGAGHGAVPPGSCYPAPIHPGDYAFSWEKGRRLNEYQLVYINQGSGELETRGSGKVQLRSGQVFFLFPGVWHRYRPSLTEGWTENWIGFRGEVADRIMQHFFSPGSAIFDVGHDQELLDLVRSVTGLMAQGPPGYQQLIAARTMEAIALVRSNSMKRGSFNREAADKVQQARQHLLKHRSESIDMEKLAADLGLSYSRFRSLFKEHTGMAPHHYLISIRLNMACYMLRDSDLSVARIAEVTGFASQFYFSRIFRKWKNCTPSKYRSRRP